MLNDRSLSLETQSIPNLSAPQNRALDDCESTAQEQAQDKFQDSYPANRGTFKPIISAVVISELHEANPKLGDA